MRRGSSSSLIAWTAWLAWGIAVCPGRGVAQSDAELPQSYAVLKLGAGLLGSVGVQNDERVLANDPARNRIRIPMQDASSALGTSFAGEAQYVFGIHEHFAFGGLLGAHTWHSDKAASLNESANFAFDVGVAAQARIPISARFELYVAVPVALTLSILNEYKTWTELSFPPVTSNDDDEPRLVQLGEARSVPPTFGFGIGIHAGARFAISGDFGLLAEVGYQRYAFTHRVQFYVSELVDEMGVGTALSVNFATDQLRLMVGAFF